MEKIKQAAECPLVRYSDKREWESWWSNDGSKQWLELAKSRMVFSTSSYWWTGRAVMGKIPRYMDVPMFRLAFGLAETCWSLRKQNQRILSSWSRKRAKRSFDLFAVKWWLMKTRGTNGLTLSQTWHRNEWAHLVGRVKLRIERSFQGNWVGMNRDTRGNVLRKVLAHLSPIRSKRATHLDLSLKMIALQRGISPDQIRETSLSSLSMVACVTIVHRRICVFSRSIVHSFKN